MKNVIWMGYCQKMGRVNNKILDQLLENPYLRIHPPKSADIEDFGTNLLKRTISENSDVSGYDLIRTFVQYTAESIKYSIDQYIQLKNSDFLLIGSGGGVEHPIIKDELIKHGYNYQSISNYAIDSSIKEALLIAVLGACKVINLSNSMPSVTGASDYSILGSVYNG